MTAVVRPVGVYHAYLGDSGVTVLLIAEIVLAELDIVIVHSEAELVDECVESLCIELCEALQLLNSSGNVIVGVKGLEGIEGSLTALNGVDYIGLESVELLVSKCT